MTPQQQELDTIASRLSELKKACDLLTSQHLLELRTKGLRKVNHPRDPSPSQSREIEQLLERRGALRAQAKDARRLKVERGLKAPAPRPLELIEHELAQASDQVDAARARVKELLSERRWATARGRLVRLSPEERALLGQTIAPEGVESQESVGIPGKK